jgi:hypothetical protein
VSSSLNKSFYKDRKREKESERQAIRWNVVSECDHVRVVIVKGNLSNAASPVPIVDP